LEYLHPDLPIALKIFGYVIAAGVILKVGVVSTKAIILGTLAYGAYVTAQKIVQAHSPVAPMKRAAPQKDPIVHTDGQHVQVDVTVNGQRE
jgi:hypothetical protein